MDKLKKFDEVLVCDSDCETYEMYARRFRAAGDFAEAEELERRIAIYKAAVARYNEELTKLWEQSKTGKYTGAMLNKARKLSGFTGQFRTPPQDGNRPK